MSERVAQAVENRDERVVPDQPLALVAAPGRSPVTPAMVAAMQATAGNRAVTRMLVARHAGPENLKDAHDASAHADEKDQREHDKQSQQSFDRLSTAGMEDELRKLAAKGTGCYEIGLGRLPPALQALIRQIQQTIADVETAVGKEGADLRALRDRMKTGARSWHDDDKGKIPASKTKAASPLSQFFSTWRNEDIESGRDTTHKQEKKGFAGAKRPLREYTAVGWQTAHQDGRLIYDAMDDEFYLSVKHYTDDMYFRILAPRSRKPATTVTLWDFDFLLFQAWESLAADLARMAAAAAAEEELVTPKGSKIDFGALSEDTQGYMTELSRVRALYATAYGEAVTALEAAEAKRKKDAATAARLAKNAQQGRKKKGAKEEEEQPAQPAEEFATFTWQRMMFFVGSTAGYIGYRSAKGIICPAYKTGTTVGELAEVFRNCADGKPPADMESIALALAALAAEPTRHPTAALEALFVVIRRSPFEASRQAFGAALPMAAGGTIATGGVPVQVLLQEAALGREIIVGLLAKHWGIEKEDVESTLLKQVAGVSPAKAVDVFKNLLFAALVPEETRSKRLPRKPAAPEESKPPPPSAAPAEEITIKAPDLGMEQKVIERRPSRWEPMTAAIRGAPQAPGVMSPLDVLVEMAVTQEYEDFTEFWDAYDQFVAEHHGEVTFVLGPVHVINRIRRRPPTQLHIMGDADWPLYNEFKKSHPQFSFSS